MGMYFLRGFLKTMRDLVFVDVETTGLDPETDRLVELSWAVGENEPETLWFGVTEVPEFIDNLIGFTKRGIAGRRSDGFAVERFLAASENATMVAANPAFDAGFIKAAGLWRFHYRMLDIQTFAFAKMREFADIPSMEELHKAITARGINITAPDHTSRNDVLAMREAFTFMENM